MSSPARPDVPLAVLQRASLASIKHMPADPHPDRDSSGHYAPVSDLPVSLGSYNFENHLEFLETAFLSPKSAFDHESLVLAQRTINRDPNVSNLLQASVSAPRTMLNASRNLSTMELDFLSYNESPLPNVGTTAKNSTSFLRAPSSQHDFVRGNSTNIPFVPGGLENIVLKEDLNHDFDTLDQLLDLDNLKTVAPGFERGLLFDTDTPSPDNTTDDKALNIQNIMLGSYDDNFGLFDDKDAEVPDSSESATCTNNTGVISSQTNEIDELIPSRIDFLPATTQKSKTKNQTQFKEWAHVVDVTQPFHDFYEKVPELAHKFPFELDLFQKRAVYHLENGDSVFVAAHTSAGKTVVAEYAIALAQKHMTRTIYTSPIKALSNQKFRDFRDRFEDVGILTGDVQIRPEASCLIMTTEILRSMLYRGADIIRDVEFVIFDEVHYVNDAERGVVWEEVIIMLPAHVSLILLSATVPNTKEFADWVGRTKKRDIYVISTLKRPVPLEHFLYVEKDLFKIVGADKKFLSSGWKSAHDNLPSSKRDSNKAELRPTGRGDGGRGGRGGMNRGGRGGSSSAVPRGSSGGNNSFSRDLADRNMYINIISLLKKRGLLPVIVFSFSKKKCEEYANALVNMDLTTGAGQKSEIHVFIEKSLARLKGTDRQLPQVLRVRELLSRGIAVHHGGLLPIIKEIVEILFTRGLVKVLFATETFAMGVNAPARAVVFSSTRKHDGRNFRELLPGEYTQMSGRAGRRGLDDTGVVIIACNEDVPEVGLISQIFELILLVKPTMLNQMILGAPTKLESQFRLTYTMILNLLRVEALKVEEMIKRSFSENTTQKMLPEQQTMYNESAKALSNLAKLSCSICAPDIGPFYDLSSRVVLLGHSLREKYMRNPVGIKAAVPGRVVIINSGFYRCIIAVIVKAGVVPPAGASMENVRRDAAVTGKAFLVLGVVEKLVSRSGVGASLEDRTKCVNT
ncbi:hypothetical protein HDU84_004687 [Entophlyctis sp. JEL0112]|nr:hypothetical protein HDU84_004687 [Entophlyctis sp. JEL0112]